MSEFSKRSNDTPAEASPDGALDFPVDANFRDRPPRGSVEDGVRLSELALEQVRERPSVFEERELRRCHVEFTLS
jgi:hypothetical protein